MCPVDTEEIKKAIDSFEDDDFVSAKEVIKQQIRQARDEYLKTKTGMTGEVTPPEKEEDPPKEEDGNNEEE